MDDIVDLKLAISLKNGSERPSVIVPVLIEFTGGIWSPVGEDGAGAPSRCVNHSGMVLGNLILIFFTNSVFFW